MICFDSSSNFLWFIVNLHGYMSRPQCPKLGYLQITTDPYFTNKVQIPPVQLKRPQNSNDCIKLDLYLSIEIFYCLGYSLKTQRHIPGYICPRGCLHHAVHHSKKHMIEIVFCATWLRIIVLYFKKSIINANNHQYW
jgi:hypothetical protein